MLRGAEARVRERREERGMRMAARSGVMCPARQRVMAAVL